MYKEILSINNPFIKDLSKFSDKKYRKEKGLFIIEGLHLVEEAFKNNALVAVLSTEEDILKKYSSVDSYKVSSQVIMKLSTTATPQPIIGVSKYPSFEKFSDIILKSNLSIVLLDDIKDPGNLGTIIRTSAGIGYDLIIASPGTVDLYNEKVLRSTQGTIYHIPYFVMDLKEAIIKLRENDIYLYGTSLKDACDILDVKMKNKFACCFGNEAHGMEEDILSLMDQNIKINMKNDVESLNVAVAAGIVMYNLKNI